jgi:hypothetical protein
MAGTSGFAAQPANLSRPERQTQPAPHGPPVFQSFIDISVLHVSSLKTFVVGLTTAQKVLLTRLGDRAG